MAIANAAVQHGIGVARPLVDGQRYDLIFDVNGRLLRVQCKWARREGDVLVVRVATCRVTPRRGYLSSTYDSTQIDAFAAYFAELNKVYVLPIEEVAGLSYLHLRLAPARNHQRSLVRMAAEYELWGCSSAGRASGWQPEGQGFEPPQLHLGQAALRAACRVSGSRLSHQRSRRARRSRTPSSSL